MLQTTRVNSFTSHPSIFLGDTATAAGMIWTGHRHIIRVTLNDHDHVGTLGTLLMTAEKARQLRDVLNATLADLEVATIVAAGLTPVVSGLEPTWAALRTASTGSAFDTPLGTS